MISKIVEIQKQLDYDKELYARLAGSGVDFMHVGIEDNGSVRFEDKDLTQPMYDLLTSTLLDRIASNEAYLQTIEDLLGQYEDEEEGDDEPV